MDEVDALLGTIVDGGGGEGCGGEIGPVAPAWRGALGEHVRGAHAAQIANECRQVGIAQRHAVDVDHWHDEAGGGQQSGERGWSDPRVGARGGGASQAVGGKHRAAQGRETVAPGERADEGAVGAQGAADRGQRRAEVVDGVERANGDHQVEARAAVIVTVFLGAGAARRAGEQAAGIEAFDDVGNGFEARCPAGIGNADQQGASEAALDVAEAIEAFGEGALVEEEFRATAPGTVADENAASAIEQVGGIGRGRHGPSCAMAWRRRQGGMATFLLSPIKTLAGQVLDFALPPRCAGCSEIIDEVDGFCATCWLTLDWLGSGGCERCGVPLEATEAALCGRCLAAPPPLDRMRAAVAYGPLSRVIALKLKYGRRIALAKTMARYMAPLRGSADDAILVPIPLHRRRLWWRGFNQAGLIAKELGARWGLRVDQYLLRRTRPTPPLKGMNEAQRQRAVKGAFVAVEGRHIDGRTVILIDDVLTTGSTAAACAKALRKAGAGRVELISWARVVRPSRLMR